MPIDFRDRTKPRTEDTLQAGPAPSWRDKLTDLIAQASGGGAGKQQWARQATGLADFLPGVGTGLAVDDTARAMDEGDYLGAGIAGLGLIPGAGKFAKTGAKAGREALTELVKGSKGVIKEGAEKAVKKGRKEAITATSLRHKPLDEAIDIAKSEKHIIPAGKGTKTSFVGAPYAARSKQDIEALRAAFDKDVGVGEGGADWYQRAQEWIKQVAGPDPAKQHELSQNLALFSAQADPKTNLGFSVQARNAAIMGNPADTVRTGQQARTYNKAFDKGGEVKLGDKTGIYAEHLDPTMENPTTGTNDIWHARALGYGEDELNGGLSPQQHSWMDAETVLAVDRANAAGVGGRSDWTPGEVQAAPWVAGKGRGLEKTRKMTPEQGIAEATKTYPDYAPSFTGYGTHEMTPGKTTGHLPNVAASDASKQEFAADPRSWWQGEGGRDTLYDAQGAYVGPSQKTTGIFDEDDGTRVINPGQAATPLISFTGDTGRRTVDPNSAQMMTGTEAFRSMVDAQDAGAWSANIPGQRMGHMNAFEVPGQRDRSQLAELMATGQGNIGLPGMIDQGPQQVMTDFGPPGMSSGRVKDVQAQIPGAKPIRREGEMISHDWSKPGSDTVTKGMLAKLNPAQKAAFSKPEVRAQVLAKMDRDIELAKKTGQPVREDLQNFRRILGIGGIEAVEKAIGKGLLPAAAIGVMLPYLGGEDET